MTEIDASILLKISPSQWRGEKGHYTYCISECPEGGFTLGLSADHIHLSSGHADTFELAKQKILDLIAKHELSQPPPETIGPWVRCVLSKTETWSTGVESFNIKAKMVMLDKWSWVATDTASGGCGEDEDSISGMCESREKAFEQSLKVVNAIVEAKR